MSEDELMIWARKEHAQRLIDLQNRTAAGLKNAQDAAESRRKIVGLTKGQAANAVAEVSRERRRGAA
nr:hypothetical protein [Janthinobacterium sp. Marseille]